MYRACPPFSINYSQGLQILLMSGVSVTSASQIWESFWNIWSQVQEPITSCQVSQRKKPFSDFPSHGPSCGCLLTWKAQIHDGGDGGHRVNFNRNLPSSCFVIQYNSLISMI